MKIQKQTLLLFAFFILAAVISWPLYFYNYAAPDTVNIHAFPSQISGWSAEELPITEHEYSILETRNAFARMYTHENGGQIILYMIYSQHNRKVAHPPEICYTGGGSTIITKIPYDIPLKESPPLKVNRVIIDNDRYQQVMYYLFKIGSSYTPSYWKQQFLIALKTLTGQPSSSAMIRLTTVIENDDADRSDTLMKAFMTEILPLIPQFLP